MSHGARGNRGYEATTMSPADPRYRGAATRPMRGPCPGSECAGDGNDTAAEILRNNIASSYYQFKHIILGSDVIC